MYKEIKYAKMSCKSLKPSASMFCLKRNLKNIRTGEYSENLISYLNNARCCKTLTVEDLNVTSGILSRSLDLMIEGLINNQTESGRQKYLLRQAREDDKIHSKLVNML